MAGISAHENGKALGDISMAGARNHLALTFTGYSSTANCDLHGYRKAGKEYI